MTRNLREAIRFFEENAGYATPPGRMACAKRLAEAERWAHDEGIEFVWDYDYEQAYCYCDNPHCKYHEGSSYEWATHTCSAVRPCEEHGAECRHAEVLECLCGIIDPDSNYRRVIEAELALEAMSRCASV